MRYVVVATGQSLTAEQLEKVRNLPCVAVSDAYKLAPWSVAMVSQDRAWWRAHPEALKFKGRKFSGSEIEGTEAVKHEGLITTGTNSGLLACHVAVTLLGATSLILLGVDLHGTHYFGPHPAPLRNTQPHRFEQMKKQFRQWKQGVPVVNCAPGSALDCFPKASLSEALCQMQ